MSMADDDGDQYYQFLGMDGLDLVVRSVYEQELRDQGWLAEYASERIASAFTAIWPDLSWSEALDEAMHLYYELSRRW